METHKAVEHPPATVREIQSEFPRRSLAGVGRLPTRVYPTDPGTRTSGSRVAPGVSEIAQLLARLSLVPAFLLGISDRNNGRHAQDSHGGVRRYLGNDAGPLCRFWSVYFVEVPIQPRSGYGRWQDE